MIEPFIGAFVGSVAAGLIAWFEVYELSMQGWFRKHGPEFRQAVEEIECEKSPYRLAYRRLTLRGAKR